MNLRLLYRNRGFAGLCAGQLVSQIGDYFAWLAMMVVISGFSHGRTATTLAVSGILLASTAPRVLFGLLAGVFVDRWDRRMTMIVSDLLRGVISLGLIPAFAAKSLPAIYALGFLLGTAGTFFGPAKSALLSLLVSDDELMSANALTQLVAMVATLLGPAMAGATFAAASPGRWWIAFVVDAGSYLISACAVLTVPRVDATSRARGDAPGALARVWNEAREGGRSLLGNRTIGTLTAVMAVMMLGVGALNALWVVYLKGHFHLSTSMLGRKMSVLDLGVAVGMIAASLLLTGPLAEAPPRRMVVVGMLGTGVSILILPLCPGYPWMVAGMTVLGLFVAPLSAATSTMVQQSVPNEELGRVNGGMGMVIDTATLLSISMAGGVGAAIGVRNVFFIGGIVTLVTGVAAAGLLPSSTKRSRR